ncbi:MAG: RecQ family ATP-dependent DNA helicase, partial [Pseudomonadales bacterium]
EAHCISEWGHNFRPDYLKLPAYREELKIPLVLLLTATATRKVKKDMAKKFAINESDIVQTGFYRPNLDLSVVPVSTAHKDERLNDIVCQQQGSGIVYVTLQHSAEQVAAFLRSKQVDAMAYHAGLPSDLRQQIQSDFMRGEIQVVVATIAFGMGIDKSDIRFVIHYDLPKSIENYSQEIGRAGRDGSLSSCITLANLDGLNTVENFVYGDTPELSGIDYVINSIRNECQNSQWELQVLGLSNDSNIRQLPLKTLLVQLELLGVLRPLYAYFADFKIKLLKSEGDILAMFAGERRDFVAAIFANTTFKKVWGNPNFETLFENYQCERARVVAALEYLQEQGCITLETKRITEVFSVNSGVLAESDLAVRLYNYFAEKEQKEIARIATLVRFFELPRCLSHHLALYFDDAHSPEICGHCSVCKGQVAKLAYSSAVQWPEDAQVSRIIDTVEQHLAEKTAGLSSLERSIARSQENISRFLAGISVPVFNRYKVRKLQGFGSCEHLRYEDIRSKVQELCSVS